MTPRPLRAALYARVSTGDQATAMQVAELREAAQARGWRVVAELTDTASGARSRRPGLDELHKLVRMRRVDVVAVWRSDRLARSLRELLTWIDDWQAAGAQLVSVREPLLDFTSPNGRLLGQLCGAFAEFEREIIRERVRAGMRAARAAGQSIGRPAAAFDHELARELLDGGASKCEAARRCGVSVRTLERTLNLAGAARPAAPPIDVERARELLAAGASRAQVALELGTTAAAVGRALNVRRTP